MCVCVCIYVHTRVFMHTYTQLHMHMLIHVCMQEDKPIDLRVRGRLWDIRNVQLVSIYIHTYVCGIFETCSW